MRKASSTDRWWPELAGRRTRDILRALGAYAGSCRTPDRQVACASAACKSSMNRPPDILEPTRVHELVLLVVDRLGTVGRTKLTKLLYLIDLAYFSRYGTTLSAGSWVRYTRGPMLRDLKRMAGELNGAEILLDEHTDTGGYLYSLVALVAVSIVRIVRVSASRQQECAHYCDRWGNYSCRNSAATKPQTGGGRTRQGSDRSAGDHRHSAGLPARAGDRGGVQLGFVEQEIVKLASETKGTVVFEGFGPDDAYRGLPHGDSDHYTVARALLAEFDKGVIKNLVWRHLANFAGGKRIGTCEFLSVAAMKAKQEMRAAYAYVNHSIGRYGIAGQSVAAFWRRTTTEPECHENVELHRGIDLGP